MIIRMSTRNNEDSTGLLKMVPAKSVVVPGCWRCITKIDERRSLIGCGVGVKNVVGWNWQNVASYAMSATKSNRNGREENI